MKRQSLLPIAVILVLIPACTGRPQDNNSLSDVLRHRVTLEAVKSVACGEIEYSWNEFRQMFTYVSIVYLQDGCAPCYPKFYNWHQRMKEITVPDDYTVLFIINARHYANFIRNAEIYGKVDDRYFHFMDPDNRFILDNSSIPRNIIDRSLMIDKDNRIRMVGEPFANADMTSVFHIITGIEK